MREGCSPDLGCVNPGGAVPLGVELSERPGRWCAWRLGGDSRLCAGRGYTSQLTLAVRRTLKLAGRQGATLGVRRVGGIAAQPGERGASAPRWKRRQRTPGSHALRAGGCGSPQTAELPGVAGCRASQSRSARLHQPADAGRSPETEAGRAPGGRRWAHAWGGRHCCATRRTWVVSPSVEAPPAHPRVECPAGRWLREPANR